MKVSISVLTIVKSRQQALINLVKGLELSGLLPDELIVVHMNEPVVEIRSDYFPVRSYQLLSDESLPLAAARNKAVACANSPHLIFIDVDCIPGKNLVQLYAEGFRLNDVLWTGPVRYLPENAPTLPDFFERLDELSVADPIRGNLCSMRYELFWSLNFGCTKNVYNKIGGFDPAFKVYGAEDTDFAFSARMCGVEIAVTEAITYHQYHPGYDPPLNHFENIVTNARVFFTKWGVWPMEGWLRKFAAMGLVEWSKEEISILRFPEQHEIDAAMKV